MKKKSTGFGGYGDYFYQKAKSKDEARASKDKTISRLNAFQNKPKSPELDRKIKDTYREYNRERSVRRYTDYKRDVEAVEKPIKTIARGLDFGKPKKVKRSFNSEGFKF